jgi:hypothetical protein
MSVEDVVHSGPDAADDGARVGAVADYADADEDALSPVEQEKLVRDFYHDARQVKAEGAGDGRYPSGCRNRYNWHWRNGFRCSCRGKGKRISLGAIVQIVLLAGVTCGILFGVVVPGALGATPPMKEFFVAADEVEWDYAPSAKDVCADAHWQNKYLVSRHGWVKNATATDRMSSTRIGSKYLKARYVEYTDGTFSTPKPIAPEWAHLGLLGPVLRGEVGDVIRVHFRNNVRFNTSIHPFAVHAAKHSEGAAYNDGARRDWTRDDAVAPLGLRQFTCKASILNALTGATSKCYRGSTVRPGATVMHDWPLEESMGPGADDPDSIAHIYTSAADGGTHTGMSAGLLGPLIVTRKGAAGLKSSLKPSECVSQTLQTLTETSRL